MPFGIVAYALMLFSWTTFVETAVYNHQFSGSFSFGFQNGQVGKSNKFPLELPFSLFFVFVFHFQVCLLLRKTDLSQINSQ